MLIYYSEECYNINDLLYEVRQIGKYVKFIYVWCVIIVVRILYLYNLIFE